MKKGILTIIVIFIAAAQVVKAQDTRTAAFNKTLTTYYNLKNALAKDNASQAGTEAGAIKASLQSFPVKGLAQDQATTFTSQAAIIKAEASKMEKEKDIKALRKNFETLSYAMIKLVKTVKLNNNPVYIEYCPMARASWLNETEDIQNPYYGSMMYDCGDVKETIQ